MINIIYLNLSSSNRARVVLRTRGGALRIVDLLSDLPSVRLLNNHWENHIPPHKSLLPFWGYSEALLLQLTRFWHSQGLSLRGFETPGGVPVSSTGSYGISTSCEFEEILELIALAHLFSYSRSWINDIPKPSRPPLQRVQDLS